MTGTPIDPPIVLKTYGDTTLTLSTVEQLIDYIRSRGDEPSSTRLREAAFIAVAVPTAENIGALRELAEEVFGNKESERATMTVGPTRRQKKPKAEIERMLLSALREVAGDYVQQVEITQADPALYGANWSATNLGGAATRHPKEGAIMKVVTALQGKYDVAWE